MLNVADFEDTGPKTTVPNTNAISHLTYLGGGSIYDDEKPPRKGVVSYISESSTLIDSMPDGDHKTISNIKPSESITISQAMSPQSNLLTVSLSPIKEETIPDLTQVTIIQKNKPNKSEIPQLTIIQESNQGDSDISSTHSITTTEFDRQSKISIERTTIHSIIEEVYVDDDGNPIDVNSLNADSKTIHSIIEEDVIVDENGNPIDSNTLSGNSGLLVPGERTRRTSVISTNTLNTDSKTVHSIIEEDVIVDENGNPIDLSTLSETGGLLVPSERVRRASIISTKTVISQVSQIIYQDESSVIEHSGELGNINE
ncbi:4675_t:CDS:1 [Racocetra fulgida]|uniref:4675_t:CDS:1 n=1 Tax=Racocetra fulgida TaxID=60492 RepID=A0A9N9FP90_9GLOM|nr:4675_t:CDS:1 [Racocetra fulgida]